MALIGDKGKAYGLIVRGKKSTTAAGTSMEKAAPVFGEESDEDDREFDKKFQNFDSRKETMKAQMKKQTQISLEKVLAEDPSVFEYDSIYDAMHEDRERKTESKRDAKLRKPKYMAKLLKTAEERKLDRELQADRKVQKELEAEGEEFRDKEKFVTASYKKKMAELRELEQRRRQELLVEDAFDVTKQDGLSGFYRYMLHSSGPRTEETKSAEKVLKESPQEKTVPERERSPVDRERNSDRREKERSPRRMETKERHKTREAEGETEMATKEEEAARTKTTSQTVTERRRREMAEAARALFSRRADDRAVDEARARYLARRQNRSAPVVEEDSD